MTAPENESSAFRVSIRAWLALLLVSTICALSVVSCLADLRLGNSPEIGEPLRSMGLLALGFYFGQRNPTPPPKLQ